MAFSSAASGEIDALAHVALERHVHRLHPLRLAGLHQARDLKRLALADHRRQRGRADQDLVRGDASLAVRRAQELLGHDPDQALREHAAHLRLLVGGEGVDDAVDRRRRAVGVHRGEDEDAEARELQRELHRLVGAELADENHVRVLAPGAADRVREARRVGADLAVGDLAFWGSCTNSTGSSMVSTWQARVRLM